MKPAFTVLRRCRGLTKAYRNKTTRRIKTHARLTNVQGLVDSKAGTSTTTGQIHAHTVLQCATIHCYGGYKKHQRDTIDTPKLSNGSRKTAAANVEESRQEDTQQILQDETSSVNREGFDPAAEFHKYERQAVPTRKAIEKSEQIFDLHNILILNESLGEGPFYLIKTLLKADYKIHHLEGFDELKSTNFQEQEKDGHVHVFVIWCPSKTVDREVERILKSKNRTRKFIIHSECSVLKFRLTEDFTVNLREINSDENNWRDRLDLMRNIPEANKEKTAKEHSNAFPLMCVMYKTQRDIFEKTWRALSLITKRIISCNNRSTEAGLIVMVMSKGRFMETEYDLYADNILKIVKDVTKEGICESLVSLKDSILKFCEGAWAFSSNAWRHGCTMHIIENHKSVADFLLYPEISNDGWLSFICKIPNWFIERFKKFLMDLFRLISKTFKSLLIH